MPQVPENNAAPNPSQAQFKDQVDENKPIPPPPPPLGQKKDGKGRKILGLFGRNKRKPKQSVNGNSRQQADDEDDTIDNDGSIISDAILRDRHDRFVTQL